MSGLDQAILGLRQAVDGPRRHHMWRWVVRNRLAAVKEALRADRIRVGEAWLAGREFSLRRERASLLRQVSTAGRMVLEHEDAEAVHAEMLQLLKRLEHYRQRVHDLVYDSVALELGGSE